MNGHRRTGGAAGAGVGIVLLFLAAAMSWAASAAAPVAAPSASAAAPAPAGKKLALDHRWVYVQTNLLVDKNVQGLLALLDRARKADYNGVVLSDSKFMRWGVVPRQYEQNVRKVRQACRQRQLECIPCVMPIGYSNDLLSHDPNLAEGLPVQAAPFVVRDGLLVPDDPVALANGSFERYRGNMPAGWSFADEPGKVTFIDTQVPFEGKACLRLQDIGRSSNRNGRVCQKLAVEPFRYYHVSAAVKTRDFEAAGQTRIAVLGEDGRSLNFHEPRIEPTQDWKRIHVTFNSLQYRQVNLYLGTWGGRGGTIWWDDVRIEPAGLVNVVRRDGAPLRMTSLDGATAYAEGKDFAPIRDPKMGVTPWPGCYDAWHEPPKVPILPAGALREGQKVLLSYYHASVIYQEQVACCMSEPKVYDLLRWQVDHVRSAVEPDGYFMSHDEIRQQGYDASCEARKMTAGEILADNVKQCAGIIRQADPGKPLYVWSDMFDPYHNAAAKGPYYLVKGDGPWSGSWRGLDKDVTVVSWHNHPEGRLDSLKHFASLGHKQILAGYYDADPARIADWLAEATQVPGVGGVMYTTWRQNYDDLEKFMATVNLYRE